MSNWRKRQIDYRINSFDVNGVPLVEVLTRFARDIETQLEVEANYRAAVIEEAMERVGLSMAVAVLQKYRLTQNE
jgi:hypothetical protein